MYRSLVFFTFPSNQHLATENVHKSRDLYSAVQFNRSDFITSSKAFCSYDGTRIGKSLSQEHRFICIGARTSHSCEYLAIKFNLIKNHFAHFTENMSTIQEVFGYFGIGFSTLFLSQSQPISRIADGPSKNLLRFMVFRSETATRLPSIYDWAHRFSMLKVCISFKLIEFLLFLL